jgi:poly-gamma-glutamate synthesis protein (capsule biosynthesis protein)
MVVGFGYSMSWPKIGYGQIEKYVLTNNESTMTRPPVTFSVADLSAAQRAQYDSLVFVGDVLLARNVEFLMRTKEPLYPFLGIDFSTLAIRPAVIGNFEAAIPIEHEPTLIGQLDFSVDARLIPFLTNTGFTHFSLGNNHSYDFGATGYQNTIATLEAANFTVFGNFQELDISSVELLEWDGRTVALIGLNTTTTFDQTALSRLFRTVNNQSDFQIVYVHWGEEYALRHNSTQRALAEMLITAGADLIVGHHPHVVQGIDLINNVLVFYSLGNYIFDQYFSRDVQEGLILTLSSDAQASVTLTPVSSQQSLSQPRVSQPEDHAEFLEQLARKSHPDLSAAIKRGHVMLPNDLASSHKVVMMHETYVQ